MKSPSRDLLVLLRHEHTNQRAIEQQVELLHTILSGTETPDQFCIAHEFVTRSRITSKKSKIIRAIAEPELRPFCFLLNKN